MEKKHYLKTLEVVKQVGSPSAKHNKLMSIAVNTEDPYLTKRAEDYAQCLMRWPKKPSRYPKLHLETLKEDIRRAKKGLIAYVESVLASEKSEWQIIAEQHGWTPPVVPSK